MAGRTISRRRQEIKSIGLSAWALFVALILLWQSVTYRGLIAFIGEWQFDTFGRYYPTLTYVLLVALLTSPALLVFRRPRRRPEERRHTATLRSALIFQRVMFGAAAFLAATAAISLLAMAFLPNDRGPIQVITLDNPPLTQPREGATTLSGSILYVRTAAFDEDLVVARHNMRFAPMIAPGDDGHDLQYFVELPPVTDAESRRAVVSMTGILKQGGLPGEVIRLYRYAGHRVEKPYYVLFSRRSALWWPHLQVAAQFGLGAVGFLLIALWQRRRKARMTHAQPDAKHA